MASRQHRGPILANSWPRVLATSCQCDPSLDRLSLSLFRHTLRDLAGVVRFACLLISLKHRQFRSRTSRSNKFTTHTHTLSDDHDARALASRTAPLSSHDGLRRVQHTSADQLSSCVPHQHHNYAGAMWRNHHCW